MRKDPKLLGFYNYTVILTYIGMLSGFMGILLAFEGKTYPAVICLMAAGFCDMFDGAVASTKERTEPEKWFGIQIDSLSDLICFGVLPAVLVYSMEQHSFLTECAACLYVLCALIRLAYFNVDEQQRQQESAGPREIYYGLPVTLSALLVPMFYGLGVSFRWRVRDLLAGLLVVMAALFLTPFQLKKPKLLGKISILIFGAVEVLFVVFAGADV